MPSNAQENIYEEGILPLSAERIIAEGPWTSTQQRLLEVLQRLLLVPFTFVPQTEIEVRVETTLLALVVRYLVGLHGGQHFIRLEAEFGCFTRNVDFEQHRHCFRRFFRAFIDFFRQGETVNALDHLKKMNCVAAFIGL